MKIYTELDAIILHQQGRIYMRTVEPNGGISWYLGIDMGWKAISIDLGKSLEALFQKEQDHAQS